MNANTQRALFALVFAPALLLAASTWAQQPGEPPADKPAKATAVPAAGAVRVYSLEELLRLANSNAAVIEEHKARIRRAEWRQYRANRAWGPRLESTTLLAPVPANADPTRFDENIDEILLLNIGPYVRQTLRVVVPVYTFGRISTAQELAELGVDVALLQAEQARLDHFFQLKQAYYGRQLSQAFAVLLREGDELVKENLARMEEARDFGEADFETADLRRLQIFNADLDTRILDNNRLGDLTAAAINYLAGIEGEARVITLDEGAPIAEIEALERYIALALIHRPEVVQLERAVQARELQQRLERRNFYPNIFVAADFGFGWSTEDVALQPVCRRVEPGGPCINAEDLFARPYANPFRTLTFGIALGMNWQFDVFGLYGQLQEVNAQRDETIAQRERALGAIRLEVTRQHREALDARRRIEIQGRRLDAARRWRNQFGATLKVGTGANISDAIDPLRAYYEARALYLEAHHNYLVARAALARAVGLQALEDAPAPAP
ncbi:MAG: TolC family protein [Bradymonadaceae bacterium]|nr:TolC family protein [Lujinxingiaceae bacterium]